MGVGMNLNRGYKLQIVLGGLSFGWGRRSYNRPVFRWDGCQFWVRCNERSWLETPVINYQPIRIGRILFCFWRRVACH
jgi:hypothetical protein